jgi:hypothetical protein
MTYEYPSGANTGFDQLLKVALAAFDDAENQNVETMSYWLAGGRLTKGLLGRGDDHERLQAAYDLVAKELLVVLAGDGLIAKDDCDWYVKVACDG